MGLRISLGVVIATLLCLLPSPAKAASPYQACDYAVTFPVTVHIGAGVDPAPWRDGIRQWNQRYPGSFVEGSGGAEVVADSVTWVEMPCNRHASVIHAGHDVDLSVWAVHEGGHLLALSDHIPGNADATGYVNPGRCSGPLADGYEGIMSYCHGPTFGPDDDAMMRSLGYRWRLRVAF